MQGELTSKSTKVEAEIRWREREVSQCRRSKSLNGLSECIHQHDLVIVQTLHAPSQTLPTPRRLLSGPDSLHRLSKCCTSHEIAEHIFLCSDSHAVLTSHFPSRLHSDCRNWQTPQRTYNSEFFMLFEVNSFDIQTCLKWRNRHSTVPQHKRLSYATSTRKKGGKAGKRVYASQT